MDPILQAGDLRFKLRGTRAQRQIGSPRSLQRQPSTDPHAKVQFKELVNEFDMLGLMQQVNHEFGWGTGDEVQVRERVAQKRAELQAKIEEAKEKHGQVEVVESQLALASYAIRTGSREEVDEYWKQVDVKSLSTGKKIDAYFERARFGFAWEDYTFVKDALNEASRLLEVGGDWDRRNRLKVYSGLYALCARNFTKASQEFLSCVATFTAEELCSYDRFIMYTMLTSIVALDRVPLRQKVVDSPEIVAVLDSCYMTNSTSYQALSPQETEMKVATACAGRLVAALYECRYRDFMEELLNTHNMLQKDRYLSRHLPWFLREMRAKAYAQFLTSYRSVKLDSMASAFGVSVQFVDAEVSRFIASKRLTAKIDKVAGVIETNRPDMVNAKYQDVIKQGDALLNRVQKLARAVNV
jgi:26S proteasome regulatory subunit N7